MEQKRDFTGVFIPAHIWLSQELIPAEKMLLGEIDALSKRNGWCDASREHFAEWLQCSPTNVTHYLSKLEKKGFIETEVRPGRRSRRKVVTSRFFVDSPVYPIHPTREPHSPLGVNPIHPTREPHSPEIQLKEKVKYKRESEAHAHAPVPEIWETVSSTLEAEKNTPPPQIPAAPPAPQPAAFERWLLNLRENYRVRDGFRIGHKIPDRLFDEYLARFESIAKTQPEKYFKQSDLTGHFLSWSRIEYTREPSAPAKPAVSAPAVGIPKNIPVYGT